MDAKQALADRLKQANNILVTVSNNPSVDQLASCIGLTLALNKLNKHATAVFSGEVPNTIEFLQPEKTIEKNTDSLRDFIISLDKSKADKLRYKVEDKVVKIFITPYRTSISEHDLEFSQGDFNVDAVVAIGVHSQAELDQAIIAHGRILHDATVTTVNIKQGGELGSVNWVEPQASSLSELVAELVMDLGKDILDEQMSTALLTGIVAETKRFSNEKTSPMTMTISADLMAAGANQQLVATKLEPPKPVVPVQAPQPQAAPPSAPNQPSLQAQALPAAPPPKADDGTLEISHNTDVSALETPDEEPKEPELTQINIDEQGSLRNVRDIQPEPPKLVGNTDPTKHMESQHMIMEPPTMGGQLTASVVPEEDEERPAGDPLNGPIPGNNGLLQRSSPFATPPPSPAAPPPVFAAPAPTPSAPMTPDIIIPPQPVVVTPTNPAPPASQTLSEIEQNVHSPHTQGPSPSDLSIPDMPVPAAPAPMSPSPVISIPPAPTSPAADVDNARNAVMQAIAAQPPQPQADQALNAMPLGDPLRDPQGGTLPQPPASDATGMPPQGPPPMLPPVQPA